MEISSSSAHEQEELSRGAATRGDVFSGLVRRNPLQTRQPPDASRLACGGSFLTVRWPAVGCRSLARFCRRGQSSGDGGV